MQLLQSHILVIEEYLKNALPCFKDILCDISHISLTFNTA